MNVHQQEERSIRQSCVLEYYTVVNREDLQPLLHVILCVAAKVAKEYIKTSVHLHKTHRWFKLKQCICGENKGRLGLGRQKTEMMSHLRRQVRGALHGTAQRHSS